MILPALALSLADPAYFETPVVTDPADQVHPAISGDSVVWQDFRNTTFSCPKASNCRAGDIYHKDLATGVEQRLTTAATAMEPDVEGDTVVWRNWMNGKVVAHDLLTGSQQYTSTLANDPNNYAQMTTPAVSGDVVVWTDYRTSYEYGNIYMRDLTKTADVPVVLASTDPTIPAVKKDKMNPDIDGNIVVWEDMRNAYQDAYGWWHNHDIYMKDLSTGIVSPVCTDAEEQYNPVVSGGKIYWDDYRNGDFDIYMYDIAAGTETRVTSDGSDQAWPSADGAALVWKDVRNGNEDVFFGDVSSSVEKAITADAAAQKMPKIDGGRIIWLDDRNGNWDIFMAEPDTEAPVINGASPDGVVGMAGVTISASYGDSGTGVDTATVVVTLDGSPLSCTVTPTGASCPAGGLSDGDHGYTVDLSDLAGNAATRHNGAFTVDTGPPVIDSFTAAAPPDSGIVNINATYHDDGIGVDASSVQVSIDGTPVSGCSVSAAVLSCVASGQPYGNHAVQLSVDDNLGKNKTASTSFAVTDTVAPQISATAPVGTLYTGAATITASFSDNAPGSGIDTASIGVTLDGSPVSGCSAGDAGVSCSVGSLANGPHSVVVEVSDLAGNSASSDWSFSVDVQGPQITELSPPAGGTVQNPKAAVSARVTDSSIVDPDSIRFYFEGVDVTGEMVRTGAGDTYDVSYFPSDLADGVTYTAKVAATDLDGNANEQTWSFTSVSPQLQLDLVGVYWESYNAYLQRLLTVDYLMASIGTGACNNGKVNHATATSGVIALGPLPVELGSIASGSEAPYSFLYMVPHGVANFRATTYASCAGDSGHTYLFPQLPPQ